jgi:hypothetical protein
LSHSKSDSSDSKDVPPSEGDRVIVILADGRRIDWVVTAVRRNIGFGRDLIKSIDFTSDGEPYRVRRRKRK